MGKPGQFDKLTIASLLGVFASFLATRRLFLQRSLLLVKAALTLHRYLAVTPFAQGGGSTRSCAIGIQSRIPSGWHFETASPFGIGRSLVSCACGTKRQHERHQDSRYHSRYG
jgi:hypothetical protein